MLLDNPMVADRRVSSEAAALASAGHEVTVLATSRDGLAAEETVEGVRVRRVVAAEVLDVKRPGAAETLADAVAAVHPDVVHCHDQAMLDVGARVKRKRPATILVYDSHELFRHWPLNLRRGAGTVLRFKSRAVRAYAVWRERRNAPRIDRTITVNESLSAALERGLRLARPPIVVRNIPPMPASVQPDDTLRRAFDLPASRRIVVCIGASLHAGSLNLEQVMREMEPRTDASLVLVAGDHDELRAHAQSMGYRNVHFHPFIPPQRLHDVLAACDVGLVPTWNRRDLSYWLALDNKLFDYVAATIPVLATRQPEYLRLVEGHGLGVCVDPDVPGAYADGLTALLADHDGWRQRVAAARRELDWNIEKVRLLDLYAELAAGASVRAES